MKGPLCEPALAKKFPVESRCGNKFSTRCSTKTRFPVKKIDCIVAGSQKPFVFAEVDNIAAMIAGVLGIRGVNSLLFETASSSGSTAIE